MTQLPLKEQLRALEQMQEIDLKIDALKKSKGELPGTLKTLDLQISKLNATIKVKQAAAAEIEKTVRQTQAALDLNKDRLTRSTSRVDQVSNSQEYAAVNKEVEQLNKMNAQLDEQIAKSKGELDTATKEIDGLTTQVNQVKSDRDAQDKVVTGQGSTLDSQISELVAERNKFAPKVDKKILSQYDRVRVARAGLGISPALGGRCKGCNMMVPPQLYNMIQKGLELHQCPSCHRILFMPNSGEGPKTPEAAT